MISDRMDRLIESIPNISEGRDTKKIEKITKKITEVDHVAILNVDSDVDHNRTVITIAGPPEPLIKAVLKMVESAIELIDLNQHAGEHPRMGAVDVIPFVPIRDASMGLCVKISHEVGQRIGEEFDIPVYLYEKSATKPERKNLAYIRRGEFEGFPEKIKREEWAPDFGPKEIHPTFGACAVGAREPLIAYNVNLGTDDLKIAKKIAKAVRHSSGGLRFVKALGLEIGERGIVQVSMNMTNYRKTPLFRVFELIKREAKRYSVPVVGSEIVGLIPQEALNQAADFYLQLENFEEDLILENRLKEKLG